jgi:glycine/D-amino acid oxidase-like deaminating enzyme
MPGEVRDRDKLGDALTVGLALWPEQLSNQERAWLDPGVPHEFDRTPDILVVGGGIVGVATAVACTEAGLGSVVLLEGGRLGSGASGGAAGQLMPEAHVGVDPPRLVELMRLSLAAWQDLERTWPGGVGLMPLDWLGIGPVTGQFDVLPPGAVQLSAEQVEGLVPGLAQRGPGVLVRGQARVNPLRALARLAAGLNGAATGVRVHGVAAEAGRILSVSTSVGELRPRNVVFATGTAPQLDGLDVRIPSGEVRGHMLTSEPTDLRLPGSVAPLATTIDDGRLMVGGTLDVGDDERVVRPEIIATMWASLLADWPAVQDVRVAHQWACFRPAHPDYIPVIDRVPGLLNAWLTSGHYKTGILLAPATGIALAEWIASGERPARVDFLGVERFAAV